jgi:23S rRNA (pseudouridine1915-N3)-methyltransferase
MEFTIISVGKVKEQYFSDAADEYIKRIRGFPVADIRLVDVKQDSDILSKIPATAYVFALCVEGRRLTSEEFSHKIEKIYMSNLAKKGIYFIIGGSDGLSDKVKSVSDMRLSMSDMTFAHRLAKIMLLEQIYRALSIQNNLKYHK